MDGVGEGGDGVGQGPSEMLSAQWTLGSWVGEGMA